VKRALALVLAALGGVALSGCQAQTEVMVVIKAAKSLSFGQGKDIDSLELKGQPASDSSDLYTYTKLVDLCSIDLAGQPDCRPEPFASPDYAGSLTLPLRILMRPGALAPDATVRIYVLAEQNIRDGNGDTVTHQRLRNHFEFQFAPNHRLWLEVPLYGECLDQRACENTNQICKADCPPAADGTIPSFCCDTLTPSPNEDNSDPPSAADQSVLADLTPLPEDPDLAVACGGKGQACCANMSCPGMTGGLTCTGGFCSDPNDTCGVLGKPCCAGSMCMAGGVCDAMNNCVPPCGGHGQACCTTGPACVTPGEQCFGQSGTTGPPGTCMPCGTDGVACCPGQVCAAGSRCSGGTCAACGALNESCCPPSMSYMNGCTNADPTLYCNGGGMCVHCGGAAGAACCPPPVSPTCGQPGALVCGSLVNQGTNCVACGAGAACCLEQANPCPAGYDCISKMCSPCGSSGGPCCSGNVCTMPGTMCDTVSGTCKPCGGAPGEPCCNGQCMPQGPPGLYCDTLMMTCQPCGNTGQACCPGSGGNPDLGVGGCSTGPCILGGGGKDGGASMSMGSMGTCP
jgi:hypothetical protein